MKKIIAIFVLSLCCTCMVFAQGKGTFRVGLRIGPNVSQLYALQSDGDKITTIYSNTAKYKMKVGVRAGFVFDMGITNVVSIQPGIYYSWQRWGSKGQFKMTDTLYLKAEEVISMQQIQIPILVNFRKTFKNNDQHAFVFGIGPYFSVGIVGQDALKGSYIDQYTGESSDIRGKCNVYKDERIYYYITDKSGYTEQQNIDLYTHPYRRFDFGLTVAAGFELKKFYIGIACDLGILNTANAKAWESIGIKGYSQRNLNLQATLGYYF